MKPSRRDFLHISALSAGALGLRVPTWAQASSSREICLVLDPADPVASSAPAQFAAQELRQALETHHVSIRQFASLDKTPASAFCIVAAGREHPLAAEAGSHSSTPLPSAPESLALIPFPSAKRHVLLACGTDPRGLTYAVLELADRVHHAQDPIRALDEVHAIAEQPFNPIRSIGRLFVSDIEDKPWFYDREMWRAYFTMLATQRFNRFNLNLGIGYDFLQNVTDAYLLFAYPFLLSVPGYDVRAVGVPDAERDRNLETLQFISEQAVAHGLDFQLGIWTHGYEWKDSPHANYTISGLTTDNHAAYSRDALAALLKACPAISGVTLRTHGESGVREGSYAFWKTVFEGVPKSGRTVRIDLHTKGLDQQLIDSALAIGMPLTLSPKYWAEHMGLPYHQAAIRDLEMPRETPAANTFFSLSTGSRVFTRYGYADFLREDRPYKVMFRIWPGTHRFLLWGDPASNAAHARAFRFCSCDGVELFEPLSFKGRRGSGLPGGRCAYAEASLNPRWDWQKYLYTYRTWGRLLYNPETEPDTWRRSLRKQFAGAAPAVESALASVTSILPIVTTAHLPSAANDTFNPELYTNQSLVNPSPYPYGDTPSPKIFGNVSPLDPQLFSTISEFVAELLQGRRSGKYSPLEVAQWLEDRADAASADLKKIPASVRGPEIRRLVADVNIQIGLGRFFAAELRSGVLFGIYQQSGSRTALEEARKHYQSARDLWAGFAAGAKGVYVTDIAFGPQPYQRGHWLDRLAAIDADIAALASAASPSPNSEKEDSELARAAIQEALSRPQRAALPVEHTPPVRFTPGEPCEIVLSSRGGTQSDSVRLYYRHVDQAERYQAVEMGGEAAKFTATIAGSYTSTKYPVQYYFELRQGKAAWLYPGLGPSLLDQPYYVIRST